MTQTFDADVQPYIDQLQRAIDAANEFAKANALAAGSLGGMSEAEAAASISAESLIDAVAELRDVNASLMMQNQLLASSDEHLNVIQRETMDTAIGLMAVNQTLANSYDELRNAAALAAAALALAGGSGGGGGVRATAAATVAAGGVIAQWWAQWGGVVHWVVMGTLEIAATAIPALVALGAAAAALYPTFDSFYDYANNLITAAGGIHNALSALGGPMSGLAAHMQSVQQAVAPDVWIMIGSAIQIVTGQLGTFSGLAQSAANVLATFSTKIVQDLQGSAGQALSGFFRNALQYMVEWGQFLGNIGHTFLNVMNAMFGVGQSLLAVLNLISKVLLVISSNPVGAFLIGLAAAMSAVYRYGTLMLNIFNFLAAPIRALIGAVKDLIATFQILVDEEDVVGGMTKLQAVLTLMGGIIPTITAAVLTAGAAFTIWYLSTHQESDAVTQLIAHLNSLPNTFQNLVGTISTLATHIDIANINMATLRAVSGSAAGSLTGFVSAGKYASDATSQLVIQQNQLGQQYQQNQQDIGKLVNAISTAAQKLNSLRNTLVALGLSNAQAASSMNVLSIQTGLQDSKVTALNQAWDQYITEIVGGESALANFVTTMGNMLTVTSTTGISNLGQQAQTITLSLTQMQQALAAGAGAGGNSAAAWQNFSQMIQSNATQIADWLQTARVAGAVSSGNLRMGILDAAEMMMQFTGATGPAAAAVLAFAQRGDPAITTADQLAAATGGVNQAQSNLNTIMNNATIAMSNASQIAQNLSSVMNAQMTAAYAAAALNSTNFYSDTKKLSAAIKEFGANSPQAQQAALAIAGDIQQASTMAANMATNTNNATAAVGNLNGKSATVTITTVYKQIGNPSAGLGYVQGNTTGTTYGGHYQQAPSFHGMYVGFQSGGIVNGPLGMDVLPAMLTAGEAVLNARAVAAIGGPLGVHSLNNQPSQAVLTSGMGGGGAGVINLTMRVPVMLNNQQLGQAVHTEQLVYDRRNANANVHLNRPGRPG